MPFPTTPLLDNFNRANESPPTGWDYHFNAAQAGRPAPSLIDQQLGIGENNFTSAYWAAEEFGPDLEAWGTLAVLPSVGNQCSLEFRLQGPGTGGTAPSDGNAYHCSVCIREGATVRRIYRTDGGTYTLLDESTPGEVFLAGDQFGVRLIGNTIHTFINGVEWGDQFEASGVTGTGYIGATVTELGVRWDDFGGGTYTEEEIMATVVAFPTRTEPVQRGASSKSFKMYVTGPTSLPVTGLAFDTAGLIASYAGDKLARVAITPVTLAAITTAWASGGFKEIDATNMPGWYRLDVPNAALALETDEVVVSLYKADTFHSTLIIPIDRVSDSVVIATTRTDN